MNETKILGIDFGSKRVGVAVSDSAGRLAFPKIIVKNDVNLFKAIGDLIKEENISEIVVGKSLDQKGEPNKIANAIDLFISESKELFGLPVHQEQEFFTSVEARKAGNTKRSADISQARSKVKIQKMGKIDAQAAALILQRYLDRKNLGR